MKVQADLLENCPGLSLDIGLSLIKVVYVAKGSTWNSGVAELKTATFPASELDEALDFINKQCQLKRQPNGSLTVYTTGLGGGEQVTKKLLSSLNARPVYLPQLRCLARGLTYLCQTALSSTFLEPGVRDHNVEVNTNLSRMQFMGGKIISYPDVLSDLLTRSAQQIYEASPLIQKSPPVGAFPLLLVVCGTGFTFIKVYQNGDYEVVDTQGVGGASFMGLGCLFSGASSFDELTKMAEDGFATRVDIGMFDLMKNLTDTDDMYSTSIRKEPTDDPIYCFGKTTTKSIGDFEPGDMARSLLQILAMDVALSATNIALNCGLTEVVMCGSFLNSELFKEMVAGWFMKRRVLLAGFSGQGENLSVHFLRDGSHIGALGALVANLEHPLSKKSVVDGVSAMTLVL